MTAKKAIELADELRPNSISEKQKFDWLYELDGKLAEFMGKELPTNPYPEDGTLLMEYPYDNIYELYLIAMYDIYNQDSDLYQVDMAMFNNALDEAKSAWIRKHNPSKGKRQNWGVM